GRRGQADWQAGPASRPPDPRQTLPDPRLTAPRRRARAPARYEPPAIAPGADRLAHAPYRQSTKARDRSSLTPGLPRGQPPRGRRHIRRGGKAGNRVRAEGALASNAEELRRAVNRLPAAQSLLRCPLLARESQQ